MAPHLGDLRELLMSCLSAEDQVVFKAILRTILNKDQLFRHRSTDGIHRTPHDCGWGTMDCQYQITPTEIEGFNCPMALRLSRLQQELQWLHSDMSTESDRNVVLGKKLDDLYSKIRSLEERNSELTQQLNESQALCGSPNSAGSPQSDATVANLKKKVKRLESDYDLVSQKYCDLNIAHEHLQAQQEKDKKQTRQMELLINDEMARLQLEFGDLQLKLDELRAENANLARLSLEQKQWIDVLEERKRSCAERHVPAGSPMISCDDEHENLGFTLLSLEVEKLQNELATQRTEMSAERHRLQQEKLSLVQQEQMLKQRLDNTIEQLQEALQTQQDLCKELAQAQQRIQRVNDGYQLLQQEKLGLASANETLRQQLLTSSLSSADLEPSTNRTTPERSTESFRESLCTSPGSSIYPGAADSGIWGFPCSKALWRSYRGNSLRSRALKIARSAAKGGGGGSSENFPLRRRSLLKRSMSSDARVEWSTAPDVAPRPTVWVSDGDAGEIVKVPRGAGHLFSCDDEEGELFSNSYLSELVQGNQKLGRRLPQLPEERLPVKPSVAHLQSMYRSVSPRAADFFRGTDSCAEEANQENLGNEVAARGRKKKLKAATPRRFRLWSTNSPTQETPVQRGKKRPFMTPRLSCTPRVSSPETSPLTGTEAEDAPKRLRSFHHPGLLLTPSSLLEKVQSKMRSYHQSGSENVITPRRKLLSTKLFGKSSTIKSKMRSYRHSMNENVLSPRRKLLSMKLFPKASTIRGYDSPRSSLV